MKKSIIYFFPMSALITGLIMLVVGRVAAQDFTPLYGFTGGDDGAEPGGALILSGTTLYGTAPGGGTFRGGTVFAINTDGTGFTNVYSFSTTIGPLATNSDGVGPQAGLILSSNTLYGTAGGGGTNGNGTVFAVNTDSSGFTNLHTFTALDPVTSTNLDGAEPEAALIISGRTLYGTTFQGGSYGNGVVFRVNTDGSSFTNLYSFTGGNDGSFPVAALVLSGNTLYGTTESGGSNSYGAVFSVNTNGENFSNLYSFTALSFPLETNRDGANPQAPLILSGTTLYGTASQGGTSGSGTVFAIQTSGTGFTNLHNFPKLVPINSGTNSDGAEPRGGLVLVGNILYGTAVEGGTSGIGTLFAVNTDGSGFTNLHSFTARGPESGHNSDGEFPEAGLFFSAYAFYGTALGGGGSGGGTVFSLSFAPQLTIASAETNVMLTWPTNVSAFSYAGFTLQSTTNLILQTWSTVSPVPVVISGRYTVTNATSDLMRFYRLSNN